MASACSRSTVSSTFSMRPSTSPRPRIRPTMRSAWKDSNSSTFSPTPANLTGAPVTVAAERAAPPRASPSSLVSTMPVMPTLFWNSSALRTASCPVMASAT